MTRPLRRPSTVGFPVFHLGGALWAGSGCSLAKRPHKTGRCGSLNTLLQGASQPWRGDTPYPAWPGGWGAGKRPCACRGRTDFVRSAEVPVLRVSSASKDAATTPGTPRPGSAGWEAVVRKDPEAAAARGRKSRAVLAAPQPRVGSRPATCIFRIFSLSRLFTMESTASCTRSCCSSAMATRAVPGCAGAHMASRARARLLAATSRVTAARPSPAHAAP